MKNGGMLNKLGLAVLLILIALAGGERAALADELSAFRALPSDPAPASITKDTHYWVSNEQHLDLFHEKVSGRGGVYVGVGTDQNYLMAGWARAELLVLMDFDQGVVDLHRVYELAFRKAENKEAFRQLWSKEGKAEMLALIEEAFPDKKARKPYLKAYRSAQRFVARRFKRVLRQMDKAQLPSFLSDDAEYEHLRALFLDGKVFMVRGDLTMEGTMQAIGDAARQASMVVRVLYLSNAEQYFLMPRAYRKNIESLPVDDESIALRTCGNHKLALLDDKYHYNVQSLRGFQAFARDERTYSASSIAAQAVPTSTYGLTYMDAEPAASSKERRTRRRSRRKIEGKQRQAYEKALEAKEARRARREERRARRQHAAP